MDNRNSIVHISRKPFLVVCNGISSRKHYMANSCKNSFIYSFPYNNTVCRRIDWKYIGEKNFKMFFQKSKKGGLIILFFLTYYHCWVKNYYCRLFNLWAPLGMLFELFSMDKVSLNRNFYGEGGSYIQNWFREKYGCL